MLLQWELTWSINASLDSSCIWHWGHCMSFLSGMYRKTILRFLNICCCFLKYIKKKINIYAKRIESFYFIISFSLNNWLSTLCILFYIYCCWKLNNLNKIIFKYYYKSHYCLKFQKFTHVYYVYIKLYLQIDSKCFLFFFRH